MTTIEIQLNKGVTIAKSDTPEYMTAQFADRLKAVGHEVTLATVSDDTEDAELDDVTDVTTAAEEDVNAFEVEPVSTEKLPYYTLTVVNNNPSIELDVHPTGDIKVQRNSQPVIVVKPFAGSALGVITLNGEAKAITEFPAYIAGAGTALSYFQLDPITQDTTITISKA